VIGTTVREAWQNSNGAGLRVYGEMVGILWKARQFPAAIRLEQLWNKLRKSHDFDLFCAYSIDIFDKQFGVLDFRINLPLKGALPLGKDQTAALQAGSKMKIHIEVDTCIDGTVSDGVGDVAMESDINAVFKGPDGKDYKMMIRSTHKEKSTEKELTKK